MAEDKQNYRTTKMFIHIFCNKTKATCFVKVLANDGSRTEKVCRGSSYEVLQLDSFRMSRYTCQRDKISCC
jgi:hypothetical protein